MAKQKTLSVNDTPETEGKDPNAVALGRKGGLKGGPARAKKLTAKQRSESARKAVMARWSKYKTTKQELATKSDTKISKKRAKTTRT